MGPGDDVAAGWATAPARDRIRRAVLESIEVEGYDALLLREVARRARVSLAKIYRLYGTREELILAALDWWLEENRYAGLEVPLPDPPGTPYEGLIRVLRPIFELWEGHPALLVAYFRARSSPGGERLVRRGFDAVVPAAMAVLEEVDAEFVRDLDAVLSSLVYGLLGRFAAGEIEISALVPVIDRAVYWMTAGYAAVGDR
ncbi:TetR family transcriptional regulator [Nocardia jiangxiensis]|uniref:TetR family transcriptional regulator n=1 Tax=Nocardia jiangxiensis TaxID=282685 RepID=UPI0002FD3BBD|nr:TetR family transcriptional regulator [Nocardia jiangxiensis]